MQDSKLTLKGTVVAFADVIQKTGLFASNNAPLILTGVGISGVIATSVLAGKASYKVGSLSHHDFKDEVADIPFATADDMSNKEKFKKVWPAYIPAVGVGVITITSIAMANRISTKQATALAAAYGLSERAFQEYKDKVVETIGPNKETAVRDAVAQDRVNNNPPENHEVIIVGSGEVLCQDAFSGRYFQSTMESIKQAENAINYEIINHSYASLSMFYDEIGIPPTEMSDSLGWNLNTIMNLSYSSVISPDNRPCICVEFRIRPVANYATLY